MRVSKSSRIELKIKPEKKSRFAVEISVLRIPKGMTLDEAVRVADALSIELAMTGIRVVRIPKIFRPDMTIFALHWVRRADERGMAAVIQETRHRSLFAV